MLRVVMRLTQRAGFYLPGVVFTLIGCAQADWTALPLRSQLPNRQGAAKRAMNADELRQALAGHKLIATESDPDFEDGVEIFSNNNEWAKAVKPYGYAPVYVSGTYIIEQDQFCVKSSFFEGRRCSTIYRISSSAVLVHHHFQDGSVQSYEATLE